MNEMQSNNLQKQHGIGNLLDVEEAAELLNISPHTVRTLVWKRKISYIKIGARVLFRPQDLEEFITANLVQPWIGHKEKTT